MLENCTPASEASGKFWCFQRERNEKLSKLCSVSRDFGVFKDEDMKMVSERGLTVLALHLSNILYGTSSLHRISKHEHTSNTKARAERITNP